MLTEREQELVLAQMADARAEAYRHACRECEDYYEQTHSAPVRATLERLIRHFSIMADTTSREALEHNYRAEEMKGKEN